MNPDLAILRQISLTNNINNQRFLACKLERNALNFEEKPINDEYILEESLQINSHPHKQNIPSISTQPIEISQENCQQKHEQKQEQTNNENKNEDDEDLLDIWNKMEEQEQIQQQPIKQPSQINTNSSCQLTVEELQKWMIQCNIGSEPVEQDQANDQKISPAQFQAVEAVGLCLEQDKWGSWADIVEQLQAKEDPTISYNNESLTALSNNPLVPEYSVNAQKSEEAESKDEMDDETKNNDEQEQEGSSEETIKYGPWQAKYETYSIYGRYEVQLLQDICKQHGNKDVLRSLRKINYEISEERKPQIRALRTKRNCKMNLLEFGRDFFIFDHFAFVTTPIKENSHIYLGAKTMELMPSNNPIVEPEVTSESEDDRPIRDYLYLPANGEILLQSVYSDMKQRLNSRKTRKFYIGLSVNKQKVAVCERTTIENTKEKKDIIEVKAYDEFEDSQSEYLGIVQTKISNFSDQWYCDTIINIPRKKTFQKKITQKTWQQLKIQLRLSETGTIVAELGILEAESSVTNCILFGQNKLSQFMMGTLSETSSSIDYIMRISGISPLLGFVALISRQMFVASQQ